MVLHLLPTPRSAEEVAPADLSSAMTDAFAERNQHRREVFGEEQLKRRRSKQTLVHLWEDQWLEHEAIVHSRLLTMLGRSSRIFARTTYAQRIDTPTCDAFLLQNHLWGATKSRYRFGCVPCLLPYALLLLPSVLPLDSLSTSSLRSPVCVKVLTSACARAFDLHSTVRRCSLFTKQKLDADGRVISGGELIAVASFSARWKVRRHNGAEARASHELIRYCCRRGEVVVGGISKLISAFAADVKPDEIVTVIDRDWGSGEGWRTLGFRPLKRLPPVTFYVGPDGRRCHLGTGPNPHRRRLPEEVQAALEELSASCEEGEADSGAEAADGDLLAERGYFPVRDAGAERHLLMVSPVQEEQM